MSEITPDSRAEHPQLPERSAVNKLVDIMLDMYRKQPESVSPHEQRDVEELITYAAYSFYLDQGLVNDSDGYMGTFIESINKKVAVNPYDAELHSKVQSFLDRFFTDSSAREMLEQMSRA